MAVVVARFNSWARPTVRKKLVVIVVAVRIAVAVVAAVARVTAIIVVVVVVPVPAVNGASGCPMPELYTGIGLLRPIDIIFDRQWASEAHWR